MTQADSEALILPELQQSVIDDATLDQYALDLTRCAEVLNIRLKSRERSRTDGANVQLKAAVNALRDGRCFGLQVHYLYQADEWTDTLTRAPGGYRLVRMALPDNRRG